MFKVGSFTSVCKIYCLPKILMPSGVHVLSSLIRRINLSSNKWVALPETPSGGGQIPEMIQVCDYDILIVLCELNTLMEVGPLNEWQNLEFEVENFGKKTCFLTTWGC